jgi:predicted dehydrogenase
MANQISGSKSSRRSFLGMAGTGIASLAVIPNTSFAGKSRANELETETNKVWTPISDRKIRVGIVGYGRSRFGSAFGFQNHPNVEVVAVSDLIPERCEALAKATGCKKMYKSLEDMVKDKRIEAIWVATDAPSHVRHCIEVLKHDKHVAVAVPAIWGDLEDAEKLLNAVKRSGMNYMMFETSCFRKNHYEMRKIHEAGGFGQIIYCEGEYYHASSGTDQMTVAPETVNDPHAGSYNGWRIGAPPLWYATHNTAYYVGVTGKPFLEVTCQGVKTRNPKENKYGNPFDTEIALFRIEGGGISRQLRCRGVRGMSAETGRIRGTVGSYEEKYDGLLKNLPDLERPALPPGVPAGGHGGSHGLLMQEFVYSIIEKRKPLVDVAMALNMTVPGIIAHESAMKDGELLKIPSYTF